MKKIIKCHIILFSLLIICMSISQNTHADVVNETTTQGGQENTTTAETVTKKVPKAIEKFVKKKMALKNAVVMSKTSIKLTWKKQKSADGYIIYRKDKSGNTKKIKKIRDQQQNYYTDKKVKYGNAYTYTIKAYKKYKGKIYYTDYKKGIKKKLKVKQKYKNGYKYFYDMDNNRIENVQSFLKNPSYCLKVNLTCNVMTIYAKDGKKGYTIPVKAYLCSGNTWDQTGTFSLGEKYRFRTLYYNSYSQWASRIHDDILFHTVPYTRSQDSDSLDVEQYNLLGTSASHGCIRLQCVAVKWINDNCPSGTKVIMYKSSNPGALGKPKLEKLLSWHTWDPTDPTMKYRCKKAGCKHKT